MSHGARWAWALILVAVAAYGVALGLWRARQQEPFAVRLAAEGEGWTVVVRVRGDGDGVWESDITFERPSGLPAAFVWELAFPGRGVACRGLARLPAPAAGITRVGVSGCRGPEPRTRGALLGRGPLAWVAVVWYDGDLRDVQLLLHPADLAARPPCNGVTGDGGAPRNLCGVPCGNGPRRARNAGAGSPAVCG
ncbi:MAG: hypothetical protein IRZ18_02070 [Clostridia bacterium]|nr:hypothetical protein [Clostridia bacterium]